MSIEITSLAKDPNYVKCPRCRKYHAVQDNFLSLCDRCCRVLLEDEWLLALDADIEALQRRALDGQEGDRATVEDQLVNAREARARMIALQRAIRKAFKIQAQKYRRTEG